MAIMRVHLGAVSHFSLAVRDPQTSARWWAANFDLDEFLRSDDWVGLTNDAISIILFRGAPDPQALTHLAFHVSDLSTLQSARDMLRAKGANLVDPGDENGPVAQESTS